MGSDKREQAAGVVLAVTIGVVLAAILAVFL